MMQNSYEEDASTFSPASLSGDIELSEVDFSYPDQAEALLKEIKLKSMLARRLLFLDGLVVVKQLF